MDAPRSGGCRSWLLHRLIWDTEGGLSGLWPARKVVAALLLSALLTWGEWVKHRPPQIALIALIHFVLILAIVAGVVYAQEWMRRRE